MQQVPKNPWTDLPPEIFKLVHNQAHSKALSQVDKKLYELCASFTKAIRLCPPHLTEILYPDDILVQLIKRYPHIKTLSLGKRHKEFGENQEKHLRVLITYLNVNQKQHPLSHIKKLVFNEIEVTGIDESRELNRTLLESLTHLDLESISIQVLFETSVLTGHEIQPILEKSLNLKTFSLNCHAADHPSIGLNFSKQNQLISATFIEFCMPMTTIESINSCPKLKSLKLIRPHGTTQVKEVLSNKLSIALKRLNLPGLSIASDTELDSITKTHPNLEHLYITLGSVKEPGFNLIGENCPKLRSLVLNYQTATDLGIDQLSKKLPLLEKFTITRGDNITGKGVAAIAQNCPKLRLLKIFRFKGIDRASIETIALHCKNLKNLEIGYCGPIAFEDIRYLTLNMKSLKTFRISNISGITEENKKELKAQFPLFF